MQPIENIFVRIKIHNKLPKSRFSFFQCIHFWNCCHWLDFYIILRIVRILNVVKNQSSQNSQTYSLSEECLNLWNIAKCLSMPYTSIFSWQKWHLYILWLILIIFVFKIAIKLLLLRMIASLLLFYLPVKLNFWLYFRDLHNNLSFSRNF